MRHLAFSTCMPRFFVAVLFSFIFLHSSCKKSDNASSFTCGSTLTVTHTAGSVAPETKTINYKTVSSTLSGASKCWIVQNLGAENPQTSVGDTSPKSRGWVWQFNRKQGYKVLDTISTSTLAGGGFPFTYCSAPSTWQSPISENADWAQTNDPCTILLGSGWRLPTQLEFKNMLAAGPWKDITDAFGSPLTLGGTLTIDTTWQYQYASFFTDGYYWSSNQNDNTTGWNLHLQIYQTGGTIYTCETEQTIKVSAYPVRCIKD